MCPGWTVIRPLDAAAARGLAGSGLLDRPVVVWLNELQGFLAPNGQGLSVHVLEDLNTAATAPVVLVGHAVAGQAAHRHRPARRDTVGHPGVAGRGDAVGALARRTPHPDHRQRTGGRARARQDRSTAGGSGRRTRTGSGSPRPWPAPTSSSSITAPRRPRRGCCWRRPRTPAGSATPPRCPHRCWGRSPLRCGARTTARPDHRARLVPRRSRLRHPAAALRRRRPRPDPARRPRHRRPCPGDDAEPGGYGLADYLEQHLTRTRRLRPVPDAVWEALRTHTTRADDLVALARAADNRAGFPRRGAVPGGGRLRRPGRAGRAGPVAGRQPGRQAEAEETFREAAAAGDPARAARAGRVAGRAAGAARPTRRRPSGRRPPPAIRTRCASWPSG